MHTSCLCVCACGSGGGSLNSQVGDANRLHIQIDQKVWSDSQRMSSAHRLPADSSTRNLVLQAKVVKSASLPTLQLQTETNVILALCREFSELEKRNAVLNCNLCHPQNSWPLRCARQVREPHLSVGFVMSSQLAGVCLASTSSLALICQRRSVPIKTNWAVSLARPH